MHILQRLIDAAIGHGLNRERDAHVAKWNRSGAVDQEGITVRHDRIDQGDHLLNRCARFEEPLDRRVRHEDAANLQSILPLEQIMNLRLGPAHRRRRPEIEPVANLATRPLHYDYDDRRTTGLTSVPIPSIVIATASPSCRVNSDGGMMPVPV